VFGSKSGLQMNRCTEGNAYSTDLGSLSMNVVPSLNDPTTEGDYFTFETDDGIDSISLSNKMLPYNMVRITRQSDGKEYVYVANEGSNNVSVIEVEDLRERKTVD
jgi:YVTN family beta-propeller protein